MKIYDVPKECPVCGGNYEISKLRCTGCKTNLEGRFTTGPLTKLKDEQLTFVMTFLKCRGNIQKLGKELNISYPTVRNRLNDILNVLNLSPTETEDDVLTMLKNNEVSVQEAAEIIKSKKK